MFGGGHESFRSQFQQQACLEDATDAVDDGQLQAAALGYESDSSQSSIFHQGKVPTSWLMSESGSSTGHDPPRGVHRGSEHTSSSSSQDTKDKKGGVPSPKEVAREAAAQPKGPSWFATTLVEQEFVSAFRHGRDNFDETIPEEFSRPDDLSPSAATPGREAGAKTDPQHVSGDVRQRCLDILTGLPKDEEGRLTSLGSLSHKSGTCKPCAYWFKRACKNGVACYNCHIVHDGQKPKRLRPAKARSGTSILEEDEVANQSARKILNERAIPSAPGPISQTTVELKVTPDLLKQMSATLGFQVTVPPRGTASSSADLTKMSL